MNKKIKLVLLVMLVIVNMLVIPSVYAEISTSFPAASGSISKVDTSVKKVWGTVTTIVQILAFAAVIFAGLRYMFASADQKADIKKGLMMLALGSVLVFAASTVVQFVVNVGKDVLEENVL